VTPPLPSAVTGRADRICLTDASNGVIGGNPVGTSRDATDEPLTRSWISVFSAATLLLEERYPCTASSPLPGLVLPRPISSVRQCCLSEFPRRAARSASVSRMGLVWKERASTARVHFGGLSTRIATIGLLALFARTRSQSRRVISRGRVALIAIQRESLLSRSAGEKEREREKVLWAFVISGACTNTRGSEISLSVTALNY